MSMGPRGSHRVRLRRLVIAAVLGAQALLLAPDHRAEEKAAPPRPGSVAVIPFVFAGKVDEELTGAFVERLTAGEDGWKVVEGASVSQRLAKGAKFRSDGRVESLLKAAKDAGADAVILGRATRYKFLDAPGVALRLSLLSVPAGEEVHRAVSKESAWTEAGAKKEVAKTAAKRLAKEVGGD